MNQISAQEALDRLTEGNQRFVDGRSIRPNQDLAHLKAVSHSQNPFAVIIGCSDSRVIPEILFDQGLGDLFVIRVAGNTVGNVCIGSVEYAVEHLGVRLVMVLGHKNCGVVKTAASGDDVHHHLGSLVATATEAVRRAEDQPGNLIDNAVKENVKLLIQKLDISSPVLHKAVTQNGLKIIGGYYDLNNGLMEMI